MASEKSSNLMQVFDKVKVDVGFGKEIFVEPASACQAAGIKLNTAEIKVLNDAMNQARQYYIERLYLAAYTTAKDGGNTVCFAGCVSSSRTTAATK